MEQQKTKWQLHVDRWDRGCGSWYCDRAKHICLFKGDIPCEVAFIGEAPGESEDACHMMTTPNGGKLGKPFVGPAGKLLDRIVTNATRGFPPIRKGFSNLVGCVPRDVKDIYRKAHEPDEEEIKICAPRLQELIKLLDGDQHSLRLIVHVGKMSEEWMEPGLRDTVQIHRSIPRCQIIHPAAILRADFIKQSMLEQRATIDLREAIESYVADTSTPHTAGARLSTTPSVNGKKAPKIPKTPPENPNDFRLG